MAWPAPDASRTIQIDGSNTGNAATWTPPANALCIAMTGGDQAIDSITGNGLTWTKVTGASVVQGSNNFETWQAQGASPSAGSVTVNLVASGEVAVSLFYLADGDSIVQSGTDNSASGAAPAVSLGAGATDDGVYMGCSHRVRTFTAGTGYTLIANNVTVGSGFGADAISSEYDEAGTTAGVTADGSLDGSTNYATGAIRVSKAVTAAGDSNAALVQRNKVQRATYIRM